jgi:hypothetical protein
MSSLPLLITGNPEQASEVTFVLSEMIGEGGDRECWRHPANRSLCIKVAKPAPERLQNDIDFHYGKHLARRNIFGPHLTRVYGWVETNRGRGLVLELAQQPDGTPCTQLPDALRTGQLTQAEASALICEAFDWLIARNVILADYGVNNFLVRRSPLGSYHLVFVDGLGARHFGLKYWSRRVFGFLARRKTRQFRQKALRMLEDKSSKLWIMQKPHRLKG